MDSFETVDSSIVKDQAMNDPIQNNPPTLNDNDTDENSVEITVQKAIADGSTDKNPEIDSDVTNVSDSQQVVEIDSDVTNVSDSQPAVEIEVSEVFYHNENNNMTYDATSEFSDIEDDN